MVVCFETNWRNETRRASKVLRYETHGHATFANRRGDHLRRPGSYVTHGEDTGATRLDEERSAAEPFPGNMVAHARWECGTGQHESLRVQRDLSGEPLGTRFGTDQDDGDARGENSPFASLSIHYEDPLEMIVTTQFLNLIRE